MSPNLTDSSARVRTFGLMSGLLKNRSTEKDLRDYLSRNGYVGQTARFERLELVAIERPGWVQVFEFELQVTTRDGSRVKLFGVCCDDERSKRLDVELFDNRAQQQQARQTQSTGRLSHDRPARHRVQEALLILFILAVAVALTGAVLSSVGN